MNKFTPDKIKAMKKTNEKIVAITAYDYSTAKIVDESDVEVILVGDSAAMVMLGYETTHAITIDEMKVFTKAVARGTKNVLVVADMPFGSYQGSYEIAINNACELIKCGANAVKIEGGSDYIVELTKRLVSHGIPVMSHLGFTPQFLNTFGGYKVQGKKLEQVEGILKQAKKLEEAGAFSVVLEMTSSQAAKYITENLEIPTIGIGAGADCDGQILVIDDALGKYKDFTPKFAKKYTDLNGIITNALKQYSKEVKEGIFPDRNYEFNMEEQERQKLDNAISNNG